MTDTTVTVEIPIERGVTIDIDGTPYKVADVSDGEIQLSTAGGFIDTIKTPEELAEKINDSTTTFIHK